MNDQDPLSPLLKTWRHQPREAPEFNREVWARIAASEKNTAKSGLLARIFAFPVTSSRQALPIAASLTILLSLAAGSTAALAYNSLTHDDRMATAYVRSIDPLQMSAQHSHR